MSRTQHNRPDSSRHQDAGASASDGALSIGDLWDSSFRRRIPMSGVIEPSQYCNLRCQHCYLTSLERSRRRTIDPTVLKGILSDLESAGCLNLALTGGEVLALREFEDLYRPIAERGFLTTVQTNGTLFSDRALDLFRQLPPETILISVYGATRRTFEELTQARGSFDAFRKGLDLVRSVGVKLVFRFTVMKGNLPEYEAIRDLASEYQAELRTFFYLAPPGDDTGFHLSQSLKPEEIARMEFDDAHLLNRLLGRRAEYSSGKYATDDLFACSAGMSSFQIAVDGSLRLCGHLTAISFDLRTKSFKDTWEQDVREIRGRKRSRPIPEDEGGKYAFLSMQCPARSFAHTGDIEMPVPYLTAIFNARLKEWKSRGMDEIYPSPA